MNLFSTLYEKDETHGVSKTSIKQLLKRLKYSKEKYYCTFSPEAKDKMWDLKIQIILALGVKSKTVYKDFISYGKRKDKKDKQNINRIKKEQDKRKKERKREMRRVKEEQERNRAKEEREEREWYRLKKEQAREWHRVKEEQERERERKRREILKKNEEYRKKPEDIREFEKYPIKKEWRILSKKYHPDKGGDIEMQKLINNIWDEFNGRY